jgi:hypothetical protein
MGDATNKLVGLSTRADEDLLYLSGSDMGLIIDIENVISLAGCSLDEHPGKSNWVEKGGGLPQYICEIARAIKRSGKTTSQAIAIAVGRVKKWAATGEGDTKAKAAAAVAEWEKLKGKAHAKN